MTKAKSLEAPVGPIVFLQLLVLAFLLAATACGGGSSLILAPGNGGGGGGGGNGGGGTTANALPCTFNPPNPGGTTTGAGVGTEVTPQFFGMHLNSANAPWPFYQSPAGVENLPFGAQRLWAAGVSWPQIDTVPGTAPDWIQSPDWTLFDTWLANPQEPQGANVDFLYTLARTPTWASQQPNDTSCSTGPGECDPPLDLNSDGSGADDVWIAWLTALAQHSAALKNSGLSGISYYEIWNEWNIAVYWNPLYSTPAQLVRMEQDARCVVEGPPPGLPSTACTVNGSVFPAGTGLDPTARIVSPSPVGAHTMLNAVENNLATYFSTTVGGYPGGSFSDEIGFHGYVGTATSVGTTPALCPTPEDVNTVIADMTQTLTQYPASASGKQLFNTEAGWSEATVEGFTDPDEQAAFLPRYLLLQQSGNINRVYWFAWDSKTLSSLYDDDTGQSTLAATAYGEVNQWTVGATVSQACAATSSTSTVWTCGFTRPGGYAALAVWDASQDCTQSSCPTPTAFTIPAGGYIDYRDVAGNVTALKGTASVQIGGTPILLETASLPQNRRR